MLDATAENPDFEEQKTSLRMRWNDLLLTEDASGDILNRNLFTVIDALLQSSTENNLTRENNPFWSRMVFQILFAYLRGFFLYHFSLSYGRATEDKSQRQRELEQYICKLLRTQAKDLITQVCIGALRGKGWQILYRIYPWHFSFTLRPNRLFRRLAFSLFGRFLAFLSKKTPLGMRMGLEILGFFDVYSFEIYNELLSLIQRLFHNKQSSGQNEWDILYIVRLLARPLAMPQEVQDALVDQMMSLKLRRKDIYLEILAELAQVSDRALNKLLSSSDDAELLAISAHVNPLAMQKLVSLLTSGPEYRADIALRRLGKLEQSSAEMLLQMASSGCEWQVFEFAYMIATRVPGVSLDARAILIDHLTSSDPYQRLLAARVIFQVIRKKEAQRRVFLSLMEIAIGNQELEITSASITTRDPFRKVLIKFLLELGGIDRSLILMFFVALRDTWKNTFVQAFTRFFEHIDIPEEFESVVENMHTQFAEWLLAGKLEDLRLFLPHVADLIESGEFYAYIMHDDGSPEAQLVRTCVGYTIRVWPCLMCMNSVISEVQFPHFAAAMVALLAVFKPGLGKRTQWDPIPVTKRFHSGLPEDSFVEICQDVSLAIQLLESSEEADVLKYLIRLYETHQESEFGYQVREQVMRTLGFFSRATPEIIALLKRGLVDEELQTRLKAQKSLYRLSNLDAEGANLVVQTMLFPVKQLRTVKSDDLIESPPFVAPSALPRIMELFRTAGDITPDKVHESWLVEYCLNILLEMRQYNPAFIELCQQKLFARTSSNDMRNRIRPLLILALGLGRPVTSEIVEMLLDLTKLKRVRKIIPNFRLLDFVGIKTAAVKALSLLVMDMTNGLDTKTRKRIALRIVCIARESIASKTLPGTISFLAKHPDNAISPDDTIYASAKKVAGFCQN